MQKVSIAELGKLRESQLFEAKATLAEQNEALEALCGMINADHANGAVLFGMRPNGDIGGLEGNLDKAQLTLAEKIGQRFQPRLQPQIHLLDCDGKLLILLKASRARSIPYFECDGRAWIREGSRTRQLTLDEKRTLTGSRDREKHGGPWKCDICGSWVAMLVSGEINEKEYRKTYNCNCGGQYWPA